MKKVGRASGNATSSVPRATVDAAERQALARLRKQHPRLGDDERRDIVAEAHVKCLPRWDGVGSYEARVTAKADMLAIDRARKEKRHASAVALSKVARPQTLAGLRAVVLHECRARVLRAMGGDEERFAKLTAKSLAAEVTKEQAVAKAARAVLRALRGAPASVVARVDVKAMTQYAHLHGLPLRRMQQIVGFTYRDAAGEWRDFGGLTGTDTERAVLALLDGAWPKNARVGMTAAEVIALEADAIRKT